MTLRWPRTLPRLRLPSLRWPHLPRWGPRAHKSFAAVLALGCLAVLWILNAPTRRPSWPREQILAAIRQVESSNREDVPDGDLGKAIGPYQIHEVYWRDAFAADAQLGGSYQQCRQRAYAERVLAAYMAKWCAEAWQRGDAEVIARVHNGGPAGGDKASTLGYWQRVRSHLP